MYSSVKIISYLIHRTLIKVNFPTYKYLKLYKEKLLTNDFLNIFEGLFCSEEVFVRWVERELVGGLLN